ncbi:adenine deaminase [Clostridium tyrobutyricum]|uniref:adenine deaminase n=1 Tax=Clostridium tyrobutyricum TaxID=1519 RepID=UPI001C390B85|nr:adenine deaminase [Clostridium tyrobutyricum]MBV4446834.1 adenine deaminase [Clostridium tyrobutyricum]
MKNRTRKQMAAIGKEKADIVLKGGNVVNVFTEEIIKEDVAIVEDTIVGVGDYGGKREIDCTGKYIVPGFIDAHMHIESTMVMPNELAKSILKWGTTTLIADPHEIVNVKGEKALDFLLDAVENVPLNIYIMIPSSVPATKFDTNGAGKFLASDMKKYRDHPRVLGLGEVMCFRDVIENKVEIMDKIDLFEDKIIDGHAPGILGKEIQAYRMSGVDNDHECTNFSEVVEKMRAGFYILIREGSGAKNLGTIVQGLVRNNLPLEQCMFCTDDKHLDDIAREGHISFNVKKAINFGVPPVKAVKMATYYPARFYGLKNHGAIAAGYMADIAVLKDLNQVNIDFVLKSGNIVDNDYLSLFKYKIKDREMLNTVVFNPLSEDRLTLKKKNKNHVMEIVREQLTTEHLFEEIPGSGDVFVPNREYNKLCVIERYGKTGNIGVAPIKGFGMENGALATTVSHDSHNIIAAGDNDIDIITAVNYLKELQGGYVIASEGKVIASLPLPIGGLISNLSAGEVQKKTKIMIDIARNMGIDEGIDPFITLSFMALPVIPEIRLTDKGLVNVKKFMFID